MYISLRPNLNFLHLMVAEIWPGQGWYQFPENFLTFKVTVSRLKVTSMLQHDVAQLDPPRNVPTKFELPTPYGC